MHEIDLMGKLADILIGVITILLGVIAGYNAKLSSAFRDFITQNESAHADLNSKLVALDGKITAMQRFEVDSIKSRMDNAEGDIDEINDKITGHELRIAQIEMQNGTKNNIGKGA